MLSWKSAILISTATKTIGVITLTQLMEEITMKGTTFLISIVVLAMMMITATIGSAKIDKTTAVGIWLLDGKDLSDESSDNRLEGTVMGKPKSVEGQFGKAMSCNGTGEYVDVTPNDALNMGEQVTITLWMK
jgi:hypothetical protein